MSATKIIAVCLQFAIAISFVNAIAGPKTERLPPCPKDEKQFFHNCEGVRNYGSQGDYFGEFQNNMRHGKGVIGGFYDDEEPLLMRPPPKSDEGRAYFGYWSNEKRNGWGIDSLLPGGMLAADDLEGLRVLGGGRDGQWINDEFISKDMNSERLQQKDEISRWQESITEERDSARRAEEQWAIYAPLLSFIGFLIFFFYWELQHVPRKSTLTYGDFKLELPVLSRSIAGIQESFPLESITKIDFLNGRNWYFIIISAVFILTSLTTSEKSFDSSLLRAIYSIFLGEIGEDVFHQVNLVIALIFFLLGISSRYSEITIQIGTDTKITTLTRGFRYKNPRKFLRTLARRQADSGGL